MSLESHPQGCSLNCSGILLLLNFDFESDDQLLETPGMS